jgi:hypothetical protein
MATLNEVAYSVWESVRANIKDDSSITLRLMKEWVHEGRAYLIKQDVDKFSIHYDFSCEQNAGTYKAQPINSTTNQLYDITSITGNGTSVTLMVSMRSHLLQIQQ